MKLKPSLSHPACTAAKPPSWDQTSRSSREMLDTNLWEHQLCSAQNKSSSPPQTERLHEGTQRVHSCNAKPTATPLLNKLSPRHTTLLQILRIASPWRLVHTVNFKPNSFGDPEPAPFISEGGSVQGQVGWGFGQHGLEMTLSMASMLEEVIFKVPSNTNHSMILSFSSVCVCNQDSMSHQYERRPRNRACPQGV